VSAASVAIMRVARSARKDRDPVRGHAVDPPSAELVGARWRAVLEAYVTSTFITIRAFLGGMLARGRGAIVTMASAAARQPAESNVATPPRRPE
jgi:NAD(P)-dependent dehydrogenase (short-subunit alcohol dehydrogenase family)